MTFELVRKYALIKDGKTIQYSYYKYCQTNTRTDDGRIISITKYLGKTTKTEYDKYKTKKKKK